MPQRHFGMDWLRIGAFQLLILYHVGMAFVPWDYQVKMVTPGLSWATIPMFLTNPWRLSLLFVVSGYASAALLAKQAKVSTFLRSRLLRLAVPLLFGMAVVVVPQPWVWLVTHFDYAHSFGYFLVHDYYRFQSIDGVVMPTWMHLWFVAYLLVYTLLLSGLLLVIPVRWRQASLAAAERILAGPMLLPIGILWVYGTRNFLGGGWEESHALVGDWTAHANYVPAFLFGLALRSSEPLRSTISHWWPVAAGAAVGGWLILAGVELAWPGDTVAPHWVWLPYNVARAVECWCAIVALIGIADRYWNADHRWRPLLAEAVFPFYIIHQTIIVVVGYWLLGTTTGAPSRFGILIAATAGGCWIFYLVGRKVRWLRPLIGLTLLGRRR
jgi:glucans biosynthesis protein C